MSNESENSIAEILAEQRNDSSVGVYELEPEDALFDKLIKRMKLYHPSQDFSLLEKAFLVAKEAHNGEFRKSGEKYIIHPLEVALILSDLELDRETIAAAILHDVIEDTDYSFEDIEKLFGNEVALLVDGVTKLTKVQYTSIEEMQAENYRKMFLAMSNDIRVIIIKIADRLHNLRTMKHMSPAHQKKKADETLDIYAPLAHRLGIAKIRYELEDLAFRYQNPDAYYDLKEKIQRKQSERVAYVKSIVDEISQRIKEDNINGEVVGRPKHFFSIYKKMKQQNKTLDQIYDLFAVRVIVSSMTDCYHVLGIVHEMYRPIPGRFKDYISMPKPNMYQSIHNTLIGRSGEPFEIQIKTYDMHRTSEYGIAAHWKYKQGDSRKKTRDSEEAKLTWLRQILEWQRDLSDNTAFLKELKSDLSLYKDDIFCFTPKGASINLVVGSTPVDFAYAIHSAVGNKMVGAKVNNRIVPINHLLATGDIVEIIVSQNSSGPNLDWLKIVKTSQAKSKINAWFKKITREESITKGKELLEKGAKKKNITLSELCNPERIAVVLNKFGVKEWDSLLAVVGRGGIKEGQVINRLHEEYLKNIGKTVEDDNKIIELINSESSLHALKIDKNKKSNVIIKGVGNISVKFSRCCGPVPGDEIVGFVTRGRGVTIHRTDCTNIINLDELERHRIIEAEWRMPEVSSSSGSFQASLQISAADRPGLVADITRLLLDDKISLISIHTRKVRDYHILEVTLPISGKEQLERVMKKIHKISGVQDVKRINI